MAAGDSYAVHMLPGMLILSVGNGLSLPVLAVAAVDGTTGQDAGLGSALFTSVQQIGGAVGVAALTVLGYAGGLTAGAICVALGAALIATLPPLRPNRRTGFREAESRPARIPPTS